MSVPQYVFARDPAWMQTTRSGFRQQELEIIILVFVMYHATKTAESAARIINEGFKISQRTSLVLGDGLYVSRDIHKTQPYGSICFKLLVYPGKTFVVENDTTPEERTSWNEEFSSAWLPPNNKVAPSGLEETCVKSASQVRVLGIAYGYELLDFNTQSRIKDQFGTADNLDPDENRVLDQMLEDLGIIYSNFVHLGSQQVLEAVGGGRLSLRGWTGGSRQLWSRTWDNCLENKETGEVLTLGQANAPTLKPVNFIGDKSQKWKLDGKSRFLHKQSNLFLSISGNNEVVMKTFNQGGDRECWRFRCLDQSRKTDSFVNFTPWQSMVSW